MLLDRYVIGDENTEAIIFKDATDYRQRISIVVITEEDYEKWLLLKHQAIELRDWLTKVIEKENW